MSGEKRLGRREIEKKRKWALSLVGRKLVLWHYDLVKDAYRDQLGIAHDAHVVKEEVAATVTEVRFKDDQDVHGTFIAKTSSGVEIRSRRSSDAGPFDTPRWFPTYMDSSRQIDREKYREYHEVTHCYGFRFGGLPFMRPDGSPAMPLGVYICPTHAHAFMPDDPYGCYRCRSEKERALKAEKASAAAAS